MINSKYNVIITKISNKFCNSKFKEIEVTEYIVKPNITHSLINTNLLEFIVSKTGPYIQIIIINIKNNDIQNSKNQFNKCLQLFPIGIYNN